MLSLCRCLPFIYVTTYLRKYCRHIRIHRYLHKISQKPIKSLPFFLEDSNSLKYTSHDMAVERKRMPIANGDNAVMLNRPMQTRFGEGESTMPYHVGHTFDDSGVLAGRGDVDVSARMRKLEVQRHQNSRSRLGYASAASRW